MSKNKTKEIQRNRALEIAQSLPEYFTKEALENMKKDFINYPLIYSKYDNGFLNYKIEKNKIILLWIAVDKGSQNKGVGGELIKRLERIAKEKRISKIEVETLSPNENYKPYEGVRKFYENKGFKLVKINSPKKKGWDEMGVWTKELRRE